MKQPRSIGARERLLIRAYCHCCWRMSPQTFYMKWAVTQEQMSEICDRSLSTVRRWFKQGKYYRSPTENDLRRLALMDFLLEEFETLPPPLRDRICPELSDLSRSE
ncbi:MAG: helix-turn-helix domain-containing protein [Cyanobacteria bacterium SID2]|nr:helix-turn-helix domain-containing protein [Cyanobacteria bacterium SID2]MBP0003113.1 helix-turn-helix domain-containing protein [Cyanobacteria bacterium SBC]